MIPDKTNISIPVKWADLISTFLHDYSSQLGNNGCNDLDPKYLKDFTEAEKLELNTIYHKGNGSEPEEDLDILVWDHTTVSALAYYIDDEINNAKLLVIKTNKILDNADFLINSKLDKFQFDLSNDFTREQVKKTLEVYFEDLKPKPIEDIFAKFPPEIRITRDSLNLMFHPDSLMQQRLNDKNVVALKARFTFEMVTSFRERLKFRVGYTDGYFVYHTLWACNSDLVSALNELESKLKEFKIDY